MWVGFIIVSFICFIIGYIVGKEKALKEIEDYDEYEEEIDD